ncbi:MAG: hypothetical protein ISQ14_00030 [Verrucomicrobiae bacterium]|jgi:hypothetical protein|nr:hypothetical protein [Verrucomicrobiae bacterium]
MSLVTLEVDIDDGLVTAREPGLLPRHGKGFLTVIPDDAGESAPGGIQRVSLPLIPGTGRIIDPTREDLDGSLWD